MQARQDYTAVRRHLAFSTAERQDALVRTTLTLDPDVADRLQREVRRSGKSIEIVVNEALRIGLGAEEKPRSPSHFRICAFVDGFQPDIDLERMNQLADEMEAESVARKHAASMNPPSR